MIAIAHEGLEVVATALAFGALAVLVLTLWRVLAADRPNQLVAKND